MGKSVDREGWFGPYTDHYDDDGNKVGESRVRQGWLSDYTEYTDCDGDVVGESRQHDGLFSSYERFTDSDGSEVARGFERDGWFERYTEYEFSDPDTAPSTETRRTDFFGQPYSRHDGPLPPYARGHESADDGTEHIAKDIGMSGESSRAEPGDLSTQAAVLRAVSAEVKRSADRGMDWPSPFQFLQMIVVGAFAFIWVVPIALYAGWILYIIATEGIRDLSLQQYLIALPGIAAALYFGFYLSVMLLVILVPIAVFSMLLEFAF
jgi:hypothetical protein